MTRRFAAEGGRLWINDINAARLDALVSELRNDGVEVQGTVGDMSDSAFVAGGSMRRTRSSGVSTSSTTT